jgi:hypothetical protein
LNSPTQTSVFLMNLSVYSRLMFFFVIIVTGSARVGSFFDPFIRNVFVFGFWPFTRAMAAAAAAFASSGTGL